MTVVRPLVFQHCHAVAHLHLSHLRSGIKGTPGHHLLCAYYATVAESMGACGYVAEDDGLVVGYVCGVWEPSLVRSVLLKRHWPEVVFWGTAQLVVHPAFITSFVARIRELLDRPGVAETGYELRPIVVAPSVRGTGIAYELVATLLADAGRRGFKHMYLFTELDNLAGNAFYRKVGFSPSGIVYRSGVSYVRYKRPVLEAV